MLREMQETLSLLQAAPRPLPATHFLGDKPVFVKRNRKEPLRALWPHLEDTVRNGRLALARVVLANDMLWNKGSRAAPAEIVYSFERDVWLDPTLLTTVQERLNELYDAKTPAQLAELTALGTARPDTLHLAHDIQDDYSRTFHVPVPAHLTGGRRLYRGTPLIFPRLLPAPLLLGKLLPVLVLPHPPHHCVVVPAALWAPTWRERWEQVWKDVRE